MDDPICSCGCRQPIPRNHLFRYKEPYLLRGHLPREPLVCECGCDQPIPWLDHYRTNPARRLLGHVTPTQRVAYAKRRTIPRPAPAPCLCGCGTVVGLDAKGRPRRYVNGHNNYGVKRGAGRYVTPAGYVMVRLPDHPEAAKYGGYVLEHRLAMEAHLGRSLLPVEHVHHMNHVKTDNRPANLQLIGRRAHGLLHGHPIWDRRCSLPSCDRQHFGHGYCQFHYARVRRTGDPEMTLKKGPPLSVRTCTAEGCDRRHAAKGFCTIHYHRKRRQAAG